MGGVGNSLSTNGTIKRIRINILKFPNAFGLKAGRPRGGKVMTHLLRLCRKEMTFEMRTETHRERRKTYSISATITLHPSSAKRLQIASPKPEPPPVTMATLPWRRLPRTLGSVAISLVLLVLRSFDD
jgi:hypothetical protein